MKMNAEKKNHKLTMQRDLEWGFIVDEMTSPAMLCDVDWR